MLDFDIICFQEVFSAGNFRKEALIEYGIFNSMLGVIFRVLLLGDLGATSVLQWATGGWRAGCAVEVSDCAFGVQDVWGWGAE